MPDTMLAAVFKGEGNLAVKQVPIPEIAQPDQVLLKIEGAGICGTDVHILETPPGHPATPGAILGHEYVGRVVDVGGEVTSLRAGQRVVIAPNLACGLCPYCRLGMPNHCQDFTTLGVYLDGGFAEYNVAPERACFAISDELPLEEAVFAELLSCVIGGTQRVPLQPGDSAVILGAGPVGLTFLLVFRAAGAGKIIVSEPAPLRADFARRIGADRVVDPREDDLARVVTQETRWGADVVVDAVGSLLPRAIPLSRRGGTVLLFGMNQRAAGTVRQYDITRNELTIQGTFIGVNTFPTAIQMLESGALKPSVLITHRLHLGRIEDGIAALRAGEAIKVLIHT
jgi:(R,R)-butanediol dehydrogenase/meso-butanediol dehydrogenase/diacetyl reductase